MKAQQAWYQAKIPHLPPGRVTWLGVRPAMRQPMLSLERVEALVDLGLEGDHRCSKTPGSARQVTIISAEHLQLVAHYLGRSAFDPALVRRNIVIADINLNALRYRRFYVGAALLEATAVCHPCSRMNQTLGDGGLAAMTGYGGLCCKIISGGTVAVGDEVRLYSPQIALF